MSNIPWGDAVRAPNRNTTELGLARGKDASLDWLFQLKTRPSQDATLYHGAPPNKLS